MRLKPSMSTSVGGFNHKKKRKMSTGFSQCFLYIPATMENKTYLKPAIDGGWWTDEIKITSTEIWACLGHQLVARRHDLDLSWPHRQRCRLWGKGHGKDLPHYFDMFWSVHMCSILWDSFESNIFELDVVSMSCQCRFHCWTPGFASLILGQPLHARRKSRCGLQEAAQKLPKKQRQVSMHFKSSDRKQMLKHVGNLETHLHYGTMICLHSLVSLMFQHG